MRRAEVQRHRLHLVGCQDEHVPVIRSELHSDGRPLDELSQVYAQRLSAAIGVDWPSVTFLEDVDPGFYAANYLRAWSLETHLRAALRTGASCSYLPDQPRQWRL